MARHLSQLQAEANEILSLRDKLRKEQQKRGIAGEAESVENLAILYLLWSQIEKEIKRQLTTPVAAKWLPRGL